MEGGRLEGGTPQAEGVQRAGEGSKLRLLER